MQRPRSFDRLVDFETMLSNVNQDPRGRGSYPLRRWQGATAVRFCQSRRDSKISRWSFIPALLKKRGRNFVTASMPVAWRKKFTPTAAIKALRTNGDECQRRRSFNNHEILLRLCGETTSSMLSSGTSNADFRLPSLSSAATEFSDDLARTRFASPESPLRDLPTRWRSGKKSAQRERAKTKESFRFRARLAYSVVPRNRHY